jgi:hypothetical protein
MSQIETSAFVLESCASACRVRVAQIIPTAKSDRLNADVCVIRASVTTRNYRESIDVLLIDDVQSSPAR